MAVPTPRKALFACRFVSLLYTQPRSQALFFPFWSPVLEQMWQEKFIPFLQPFHSLRITWGLRQSRVDVLNHTEPVRWEGRCVLLALLSLGFHSHRLHVISQFGSLLNWRWCSPFPRGLGVRAELPCRECSPQVCPASAPPDGPGPVTDKVFSCRHELALRGHLSVHCRALQQTEWVGP